MNTYTDRYGNTTGWVGGKYQSTYSDGYGGTTGTVGNKRITLTMTSMATLRAQSAGIELISTRTVPASLTGTVGQRRLNCYSNRFTTTRLLAAADRG